MVPPSPSGSGDVASASLHSTLRVYYFVAYSALGLYLPLFPSWLKERGFSGVSMAALVMLMPLCQLLAPVFVGGLADRLQLRGRMMTFCAAVTATGMSVLCVTSHLTAQLPFVLSWLCLFLFAALRGPSVGLADVLAMESQYDYGRLRVFGSLGFMGMALLGPSLIDVRHPALLPCAMSVTLWLLVLVSRFLPQASRLPPRPVLADATELLAQPRYQKLLVTMVLIFTASSAYDLCATMLLMERGANGAYIGKFWAVAVIAEVVVMSLAAPWVERIGPGKVLALSCAAAALRWLFIASTPSLSWLLAFQPLHALSFGSMWMGAICVLRRELGAKGTATAHGLFSSAIAVGNALGLLVWSVLYEREGGALVFGCASVLAALSALSAARLIRPSATEFKAPLSEGQA